MSGEGHQLGKEGIAREILAYLAEHPEARDTQEGIIMWWLLEGRIKTNKHLAATALDDLVAKGLVQKATRGVTRSEYYFINKDKQAEIMKFLNSFQRT